MYFLGLDFESTSKTLGTASVELNGNPTPFPWAAQIRFAPRRGFLGRTKSCHPYSSEHLGHSYKTLSGFDPKKNYWSNGTIFRIHDKLGYFLMLWQKNGGNVSPRWGGKFPSFFRRQFVDRDTPVGWPTKRRTWDCDALALASRAWSFDKGQENVKGKPDLDKFIDFCWCTISKMGCAACPQKCHDFF